MRSEVTEIFWKSLSHAWLTENFTFFFFDQSLVFVEAKRITVK
jgi:hypothetical protein